MFLEKSVKARAEQYGVDLRPDISVGFRPPDDVYLAAIPNKPPVLRPWPAAGTTGAMGTAAGAKTRDTKRGWSTRATSGTGESGESSTIAQRKTFSFSTSDQVAATYVAQQSEIENLRASYDREGDRPTHYETEPGFSLAGSTARNVYLGRDARAENDQNRPENVQDGAWWRIVPQSSPVLMIPLPLLIQLDDGSWTGAAALPKFVATLTVKDGGVVSLIYRRAPST